MTSDLIRVIVAGDFSDEIMQRITDVSDQLIVERHFPHVPETIYTDAEILYSMGPLPEPDQAPRLRWIQWHYAGVDKLLNRPIIQAEDVEFTNASGAHAIQMAEYCLTMMLAFMYKLPLMLEHQREGKWLENRYDIYAPHSLRGLTLGIAGYGSVGRELARMADALGMTVVATKRDLMRQDDTTGYAEPGTGDETGEIPERLYPPEALASMAKECDFLAITVPLTESTYQMVNENVLKQMKKTAVLINVGRGEIIDQAALISALAAEEIGGAALDVFEEEPLPATSPLWNLNNVIISPHVSGNSSRLHEFASNVFIENLTRYVEKRPLLNVVNRSQGY